MYRSLKKGEYKAVFSDIDGTLLNRSHKIPEKTKEKIQELDSHGIPFVLVSARMPKGMVEIRDELGVKSPMICYSGALIVDEEGNALYDVTLGKEDAYALCMEIQKLSKETSVNIYSVDSWMVDDLKNPWVQQEMDITNVQAEEVSFQDPKTFQRVHKILCMGMEQDISFLEKELQKQYPQIRIYKSKDTYLEIMSMDASKSDAVDQLKDKFHITREEVMAFGDGENDTDMLQYAGLGVAMENASDRVKAGADYVTKTNEEEGLRQVLDQCFVWNK